MQCMYVINDCMMFAVSLSTFIDYRDSIHYQDIFRATIVIVKFNYCSALVDTFVTIGGCTCILATLTDSSIRLNKHCDPMIQMHQCILLRMYGMSKSQIIDKS